jgi:uncharacterized UBP type Zn finger protein
MSKDEIKTIKNNSAIISNPDLLEAEENSQNGLTQVQIQTLIKSLQSISFKQPVKQPVQIVQKVKEVKPDDTCLSVNKLWYEQYSCYVDSVLFTLFSFPTPFVERYLLHPDMEEIDMSIRSTNLDGKSLTEPQITKVMTYIRLINQVLIQINNHFRGTERMDYCRNLRPVLLKDPFMILQNKPEYVFAQKKQEDAGEFIQALVKTFFINTINFTNIKSFSNSVNSSISDSVTSIDSIPMAPFFVYTPDQLQQKQLQLTKTILTKLDIDDYFFGNQSQNSQFQSNKAQFNNLKKTQQVAILTIMLNTLKDKKKTPAYEIPEYKQTIDLILANKQIEVIRTYTLEQLTILYRTLQERSGTFFTNTIFPIISQLKKDPKSAYYKAGEEIVKLHSIYYDVFKESENYEAENKEENKFIIINVKRFNGMKKKDSTAIEIPETVVLTDSATKEDIVLVLNQIVVHDGSTVAAGHYTVRFRCKDNWYLYNDIGPEINQVGVQDNDFVKKNCSVLIYSNINPTI